jgi:nucleoside-diphosphate-sugar epimerase
MAVDTVAPTTLLLGGGYTLQLVATKIPHGSFVITSRSAEQCEHWRARGWEACQVAIDDPATLERLFAQYPTLRVLVDSVPPLRTVSDDAEGAERGVQCVVRALAASSIERIVYLSTTGVFGIRDGSWVDESTPPAPWNSQGRARQRSEDVYAQAARVGRRLAFTALRLPAIYGADRGVAVSLRSGTYSIVGDGSQWTNRIHVEDLAEVIVRCVAYMGVLPPVMCVSDDCPTQAREVVAYLCEREGLAWPPSVAPDEVLRRGAYTMLSNQRVRNALMKSVLGVSLRYPSYREGMSGS